jgi:Domain of unknown function (DUF5658)
MLLPVAISRPPLRRALILVGFVGFQVLDSITTHLGLAWQHVELNRVMEPVMASSGELAAYALKGCAVAMLLALLMLIQRRQPRIWQAYQVAACLSAAAVVVNIVQLL